MSLYIKGMGHYVPEGRVTNADLEKLVDTNDEWVFTRTGIKERAIADETQATSDLALQAAKNALADANMSPEDMDAVIVATCTPDTSMPGAASYLQAKLKTREVMAMDLNAACSGFVYGMVTVEGLLSSGRFENILFVAVDKFTSTVNFEDRGTCILFGDGAGACVVSSKAGGPKMAGAYVGGDGSLTHLLWRPGGGSALPPHKCVDKECFVEMNGSEVFKHAVRGMGTSAIKTLESAGWTKGEIDWLIPHQANIRLIDSAMRKLALPKEKVVVNIQNYGNMSAASIPVAMSEARENFKQGQKVLCVAFGAGFTWGGIALQW